jgi:hypothetical protein
MVIPVDPVVGRKRLRRSGEPRAKSIADLGSEPQALSLDELKAYVRREAAYFGGIVKASGARVD